MNVIAPVSRSTSIYNELVMLDPDDCDRASIIEHRLRGQIALADTDVMARIGLILACIRQGKADLALTETRMLWPLREELDPPLLAIFQHELIDLGAYEQASELKVRLAGIEDATERAATIALNSGDLDGFATAGGIGAAAVVDRLRASGLALVFPAHQDIIRRMLAGRQIGTSWLLTPSIEADATSPEVCQHFYLAAPYAERTTMEDELYAGLADLYGAAGLEVASAWELVTPMLMDMSASPRSRPR